MLNNLVLGSVVISATVVVHTLGLIGLSAAIDRVAASDSRRRPRRKLVSIVILVHGLILLHWAEICIWAVFYRALGAVDAMSDAIYFSSITFSTLGYGDSLLREQWRMLAGMEGLSGFVLIGWSTAYLVAASTRIGPFRAGHHF